MSMTSTPRGWPIPDRSERATVPRHLQGLGNAIDNDLTSNVSRIDAAATTEKNARIAGDKSLTTRADTEETERKRNDEALASSINGALPRSTGWREIDTTAGFKSILDTPDEGYRNFLQVQRAGTTVTVRGYFKTRPGNWTSYAISAISKGFQPAAVSGNAVQVYRGQVWSVDGDETGEGGVQISSDSARVTLTELASMTWVSGATFFMQYPTEDDWPSTLPGKEITPPSEGGTGGAPVTLEQVRADLKAETSTRASADTKLDSRTTQLESRASSLESTDVKLDKRATDLEYLNHSDFKAFFFDLIKKQWQPGNGFNLLFAGSSTAEGYGSAGMDNTDYNGRSWVERVIAALTPNPVKWNIDGKGTVFDPPSTGIWGYQFAKGGTTSSDYMPSGKISQAGTVKPAVMFHGVGSNNYVNQWGLDDFESQVIDVIEKVNKVSPKTKHVLVTYQTLNGLTNNNPGAKWWEYNDRMKKIADSRADTYFFDLSPDTWSMGMPGANHWWAYQTDENHVTQATHRYYAARILEMMGVAVPPEVPEVFTWGTFGGGDKNPGDVYASRSVGKRAYPRNIVTQGVVFGRSSKGGAFFNLKLNGNDGANPTLSTNSTTGSMGMPLSHSFYLPPHVEGVVTLSVDNTAGYVTGSGDYQSVVSMGYPA